MRHRSSAVPVGMFVAVLSAFVVLLSAMPLRWQAVRQHSISTRSSRRLPAGRLGARSRRTETSIARGARSLVAQRHRGSRTAPDHRRSSRAAAREAPRGTYRVLREY